MSTIRNKKEQHQARMAQLRAEGMLVVARGVCPVCGTALVRNSSMENWWQCGGYAAPSHRRPEHKDAPKCNFQVSWSS